MSPAAWQVQYSAGGFRFDTVAGSALPDQDLVVVDFSIGGICGTDIGDIANTAMPVRSGWPLHEIVGRVVSGGPSDLQVGDLVVGWASDARGLRSRFECSPSNLALVPAPLSINPGRAIIAQPLATVMCACDRIGDVDGKTAIVLGAGSIGLLFISELSRRGATVVAVDVVDRSAQAQAYGADRFFQRDVRTLPQAETGHFDVVVEAIGHDPEIQASAFSFVADGGSVYVFGVPDDDALILPLRAIFFRNARILMGITTNHAGYLQAAIARLTDEPWFANDYVTHVFEPESAAEAFRTASTTGGTRTKVIIAAVTPTKP